MVKKEQKSPVKGKKMYSDAELDEEVIRRIEKYTPEQAKDLFMRKIFEPLEDMIEELEEKKEKIQELKDEIEDLVY